MYLLRTQSLDAINDQNFTNPAPKVISRKLMKSLMCLEDSFRTFFKGLCSHICNDFCNTDFWAALIKSKEPHNLMLEIKDQVSTFWPQVRELTQFHLQSQSFIF